MAVAILVASRRRTNTKQGDGHGINPDVVSSDAVSHGIVVVEP